MSITHILPAALLLAAQPLAAQSHTAALSAPFGWATCTSLSATGYTVTGGGTYAVPTPEAVDGRRVAVVASDGGDMRQRLMEAIAANDVIIVDGSRGPLSVGGTMTFTGLRDKTIIGRNHAVIATRRELTADVHRAVRESGVLGLSTKAGDTIYTLPNGQRVKEECEYAVRRLLMRHFRDTLETYRHAGLFQLNGCENIVLRNLTLQGPGAVDVSGDDLLTLSHGSRHVWVDHCEFVDGMDGNFDINGHADFVTVSWCLFRYTERAIVHANTNLVGSSDRPEPNGRDNLNVTYAFCHWGAGCNQRMPMVRFGTIHVLNCLYTCVGNSGAVNPRRDSEVLVEGCFFAPGVRNIFHQSDALAWQLRGNVYSEPFAQPEDKGVVGIPYKYDALPATVVSERVGQGAGATLGQ